MNSRRLSQSVFNELQLGEGGIGLTGSTPDVSGKYDKVHFPRPDVNPDQLLAGSAEDSKEILILVSYMIRTWQTLEAPRARMNHQNEYPSRHIQCFAVGNGSALPPPVKFNRGFRKCKLLHLVHHRTSE
jgi:hypothetical protein